MDLHGLAVGFALTGSFCTISDALIQAEELTKEGINLVPIISDTVNETDTRFGSSEFFKNRLYEIEAKAQGRMKVYPSVVNFVLVWLDDAALVNEKLHQKDISLRFFDDHLMRVSVGDEKTLRFVLDELETAILG